MRFFSRYTGDFNTPKTVATNDSTPTEIVGLNTKRSSVTLLNVGDETVYLGKSGVTSGTGFPLGSGESVQVGTRQPVYGIAASGTPGIAVWEEQRS